MSGKLHSPPSCKLMIKFLTWKRWLHINWVLKSLIFNFPAIILNSSLNQNAKEEFTYFSSNLYIFFSADSHGRPGSSTKEDTCFSNFTRSWYSKAASLNASAFPSGQSKCLRTARSST